MKSNYNGKMGKSAPMKKMENYNYSKGVGDLKDGADSGTVRQISTESAQYDMGKMDLKPMSSKGYAKEAWNYTY